MTTDREHEDARRFFRRLFGAPRQSTKTERQPRLQPGEYNITETRTESRVLPPGYGKAPRQKLPRWSSQAKRRRRLAWLLIAILAVITAYAALDIFRSATG